MKTARVKSSPRSARVFVAPESRFKRNRDEEEDDRLVEEVGGREEAAEKEGKEEEEGGEGGGGEGRKKHEHETRAGTRRGNLARECGEVIKSRQRDRNRVRPPGENKTKRNETKQMERELEPILRG